MAEQLQISHISYNVKIVSMELNDNLTFKHARNINFFFLSTFIFSFLPFYIAFIFFA